MREISSENTMNDRGNDEIFDEKIMQCIDLIGKGRDCEIKSIISSKKFKKRDRDSFYYGCGYVGNVELIDFMIENHLSEKMDDMETIKEMIFDLFSSQKEDDTLKMIKYIDKYSEDIERYGFLLEAIGHRKDRIVDYLFPETKHLIKIDDSLCMQWAGKARNEKLIKLFIPYSDVDKAIEKMKEQEQKFFIKDGGANFVERIYLKQKINPKTRPTKKKRKL